MSGERSPVWEDPNVKAAMADGRELNDIAVLNCPSCGRLSYYNQGSHFTCRHCDRYFYVASENEDVGDDVGPCMRPDIVLTMEDVLDGECSDYP